MRIREVELRLIGLPLVRPFRTSFGVSTEKACILVRVTTDDAEGWGECVADIEPGFSEEFNEGAWLVLRDFLAPALLRADDITHRDVESRLSFVRGNPMAKAALIDAILDAELRERGESLAAFLGSTHDRVVCGVSVGISSTTDELRAQVDRYLTDGYRRIKLKIEPGLDVERVAAIREAHPDIRLSVDANAAYTLEQVDVFHALDAFGLLMVEQPLRHDDLLDHAKLQTQIRTDLCLDESIRSAAHAAAAIELGACRIVNIKQGRVGGVLEAAPCSRRRTGRRGPGLVRRHARDGRGSRPEPGAGLDAGVHAPRRHQCVRPLLPRGPHRAVRDGRRRHDGRAYRARHRRGTPPGPSRNLHKASRDPASVGC